MRAISNGKNPQFLLTHKGIGYFAGATARIEERLPDYLRPSFNGGRAATAHTGRNTAASTAMNAPGAEACIVQRMTHHKSVDQMSGYVEPQPEMLMAAPLSIMGAVAHASAEKQNETQSNSPSHTSTGINGSSSSSSDTHPPDSPAKVDTGIHTRTRSSPSPQPKKARHTVQTNGNTYHFNYNF